MINHKGGSTQNAKELKAKAKQDVVAPSDYNEMIFQLKAFAAMTNILFGEGSVVTKKLTRFIRAIDTNALIYKTRAALDDFFPSKVLWAVCNWFQTFLTTCTHARDRDDVDDSIIEFTLDHTDIVLDRFSPTLLPCFKEVKNKVKIGKDADNENKNKKVKKSKKQKKDQDTKQQRKQEGQTSNSEMTIKNEHQCKDFKLREGEQWRMFKTA